MKTILTTHLLIAILFFPFQGEAQLYTISGKVTCKESGKTLESVNVFESNSDVGTITNSNGFFKLELGAGAVKISVTDVGYESVNQNFVLKNDTILNVKMVPEKQSENRRRKQTAMHCYSKLPKKQLRRKK